MSGSRGKKVHVWTRLRPTSKFSHQHIELQEDGKSINVHLKRQQNHGVVNNQILDWSFKLDGIFHNASQDKVYDTVTSDIVTSTLDGINGTLMCYGQTGAGKTFTMTGATESYQHRGLIPRALSQLYKEIEERIEYAVSVRVSYMEIYNEVMSDLLVTLPEAWTQSSAEPMTIVETEDGISVKGLSYHLANSEEEALNLLFEGETNRAISAHSMNKHSSRSHCIFTVYIEARSRTQSNAKYVVSKLNFVDLAGSERLSKTKSEGKTQTEAMYINKSLSFLEQVVIALADKRREHIPYRQSKLTHCLKDSIGGNSNTLLIANIWGEVSQIEETVSTLRFATRMMCVASEPAVNAVFDPVLLVKELQKEITHLKSELAMHDTLTNRSQIVYDPLSEQQRYEIRQQVRKFVDGNVDEIDIINIRQIEGVFETFKELYTKMDKDVEERLKQKYVLMDKAEAAAAAQKSGISGSDDGSMVGETDGQGFGVGVAPRSARADPSSVVSAKKRLRGQMSEKRAGKDRQSPVVGKTTSPSVSAKGERDAKSPHTTPTDRLKDKGGDDKLDDQMPGTPISSMGAQTPFKPAEKARPSTPPTRTEAFEEFKHERGSEINRILLQNKEVLASRKGSYADLAHQVNATKIEIDRERSSLDMLKKDRETNGQTYNEEGEVIITEGEFLGIKHLKELKNTYKTHFEDLKQVKAEVQYCQHQVDQCRQRLVQEFDIWYAESFLTSGEDGVTSVSVGIGRRPGIAIPFNPNSMPEDEQEKFDRLQMALLMNNPDSAAFYNAQMRTQRRKTYESAMDQAQPSFNANRSVVTPTRLIRNGPPTLLEVQQ